MASGTGCRPAPAERSCRPAAARAASACPPDLSRRVWRIGDRSTFAALRTSGTRARREALTVSFLAAGPGDPPVPRVAYAIGKRVGGAVERNRLRRRLRGVVGELAADGDLPAGAFLIGAGPEAGRLNHEELRELVNETVQAATGGRR